MLLVLYKICCSCCSNISEQQNSNKNGVIYYCLMLLMCWLKAFYCIHLLCGSICNKLIISDLCILFPDAAYLHHWLSVTIHFNRYNLRFNKYTECRDKCKSLYFIALHIRVVPPLFSPFVECPLSVSTCWMIGLFRMDVTERLLNTKIMLFLEFLRFAVGFLRSDYLGGLDSFEKV